MPRFTVGELKRLIKDLPDDLPILAPMADHCYREVELYAGHAYYHPHNHWNEDIGDDDEAKELGLGIKYQVLIVS